MREKFTKDSVDKIYEFARDVGYEEGFNAGYKQGIKYIQQKIQKIIGGLEE